MKIEATLQLRLSFTVLFPLVVETFTTLPRPYLCRNNFMSLCILKSEWYHIKRTSISKKADFTFLKFDRCFSDYSHVLRYQRHYLSLFKLEPTL